MQYFCFQNNGIIKVRFKSAFWQNFEEVYDLIEKLVEERKGKIDKPK